MTREEAIKILNKCRDRGFERTTYTIEEYHTARDMAIKALEQETCDDAISRQSAIFLANDLKQNLPDDERIADMVMAHNEGILEYQTQLSLLPPVTPQQSCEDIAKAFQLGMALGFAKKHDEMDKVMEEVKKAVIPQPKTGYWIRVTDKTGHLVWECDKCGWQQRFNTNFYPDCGSHNEGD